MFLDNPKGVRLDVLCNQAGMETQDGKHFNAWAAKNHLTKGTPVGFVPTNKFTQILRELQYEKPPKPIELSVTRAKI